MTSATTQPARGTGGRRAEGHGLIVFASVMLLIIGCFNLIYGIAAIANSHVFVANAHYVRSPALARHIHSLRPADFATITLDRPGHFGQPARPRVHEDPAVKLTAYPGTVRQLIVTGLGRDQPTVIITNDQQATTRNLIGQYARRMTIEQRLAEIIRAFCADALSSTVNLNVDLDIMLAVFAQALLAALRARLPGYSAATPDTIQRRFLETPGQIITTGDAITVRLERRAYSPVLRKASLPPSTTVPWWGNRTLRYELA